MGLTADVWGLSVRTTHFVPLSQRYRVDQYRVGLCYRAALLTIGAMCAGLGLTVLAALATHRLALAQVIPSSVPMSPLAALGFVVCGTGLLGVGLWFPDAVVILGMAAVGLSLAAAAEHLFGMELGLERLLAANLACGPGCVAPVAPNTTVCLLLSGLALAVRRVSLGLGTRCTLTALLGGAVSAIGASALFGYMVGVPLYCWQSGAPMSFLSSFGGTLLGLGVIMSVWRYSQLDETGAPCWFPQLLGTGAVTLDASVVIALGSTHPERWPASYWQATVGVLVFGGLMSVLSCGFYFRRRAGTR